MIDFEEIKQILPQRFPFILIDRVIEYERNERLVAIKNVSGNDINFLGHFPNNAIMPGNLISEAAAQAAIILYHISKNEGQPPLIYLLGLVKANFYFPVVPGDQLAIEAIAKSLLLDGGYISNNVRVGEKLVAQIDIIFKVKR